MVRVISPEPDQLGKLFIMAELVMVGAVSSMGKSNIISVQSKSRVSFHEHRV